MINNQRVAEILEEEPTVEERREMEERRQRRIDCINQHAGWLREAIGTGKGSRNRRHFFNFIINGNRVFKYEEDEYRYICKFGRGWWDYNILASFNKEQQTIISNTIAREFGAFDY